MGKYIKLFDTHSDYNTYITGQDKILPNVSYCENESECHYNPYSDPRLIVKYTVEDNYEEINLLCSDCEFLASDYFSKVEIDNVEVSLSDLDENYCYYELTQGEHIVKYTLLDPTTIEEYLFTECNNMTSVTIPNSVTTISDNAFYYCSGLTNVTIPNSVTSIGDEAFRSCSGLTSVTIPNSVTTIGEGAFGACSGLTSIKVDSGNSVYDSRNNCKAIIETATNTLIAGCQNTVIPNSVTTISDWAFDNCSGLTSITIPNSVTSIGNNAFGNCSGLTNVVIPNSVTTIGNQAFRSCSGLTSVTIGNSVTSIGYYVFGGCSGLTSIGGVGSGASVEIPNSVTSIGECAFEYCRGLTNITIPNSVTEIGNNAFDSCIGLTSVTIPNSVTTIGYQAFISCSSLTSVTSLATTAPTINNDTFQNVKTGGTLTVPSGSTGYNVWMGTGNYYLGMYGWTKVEQ